MGLKKYVAKRDFTRTPEPRGRARDAKSAGHAYVIQKHAASHLHYDFRLQVGDVMASWAVPKGPCLDPAQRRLAVHVEDHPLDYRNFEGIIPAGEYGGGTVMVWDRGTWESDGNPAKDVERGKLRFTLHGKKLKGGWILTRMGGRRENGKDEWLLIKERDDESQPLKQTDVLEAEPRSVLSHRTLEQIAADPKRVWRGKSLPAETKSSAPERAVKKAGASRHTGKVKGPAAANQLDSLEGTRQAPLPKKLEPQLATRVAQAPAGDQWLHEIKFDGYRLFCIRDGDSIQWITRKGNDWTAKFGDLTGAAAALPSTQFVLDGEVVAIENNSIGTFDSLQKALSGEQPAFLTYYAFDLLHLDGYDLRGVSLEFRKAQLETLLKSATGKSRRVQYSDHFIGSGDELLQTACHTHLEGIISKRRDRPYTSGRSRDWQKCKCGQGQELVIGGFTRPAGARHGFRSLLLGYYSSQGLEYAGKIGTGFSHATLEELGEQLLALKQSRCPFVHVERSEAGSQVVWVRPKLVAQVEFSNWTAAKHIRQGVFHGLREDKRPEDVTREVPDGVPRGEVSMKKTRGKSVSAETKSTSSAASAFQLTHPERVLYAEQGITKLDLANYYAEISHWILPHLTGRPLSLFRCPDGIQSVCFFQKHASPGISDDIRQVQIQEKHSKKNYLVVDDLAGLIALVQMGALELHVWGAKANDVDHPDRMVFDLDPAPDVPWNQVIEAAQMLREFLSDLGLTSFVKTTGGKGLHVVVPIDRRHTWPEVKQFCKGVADFIVAAIPSRFIAVMSKAARTGKIFIDYLRNDRGSTAVAAYSTRARDNAPVSTPLDWKELKNLKSSAQYTLSNLPGRLQQLRNDPWAGFEKVRQRITAAARRKLAKS